MSDIFKVLEELSISYKKYDHPAIKTVAQGELLCPFMEGLHFKNLFIKDKKVNNFYLVVIEEHRQLDTKALKPIVGWKAPSFAGEELLMEHLGLYSGAVSPFGLINDDDHSVVVVLDKLFLDNESDVLVHFHPNVNTATIGITVKDFIKFLDYCGNKYIFE